MNRTLRLTFSWFSVMGCSVTNVVRGVRVHVANAAVINVALCFVFAVAPHAQTQPARLGVKLSADSVMVGDPFVLTVTLEVSSGAHVTWPAPADSNGPIALREPVKVSSQNVSPLTLGNDDANRAATVSGSGANATSTAVRRETATYALAAWAMGSVPIAMPDIKVRDGTVDSAIPFSAPSVFVKSVLPADTSLRVPKPAKGLFPRIVPWWEMWWPVLVVILLLLLLTWFVIRHRRRLGAQVELNPFVRAERDFQRLDKLALNEAGEPGRFVALALEVMRTYIASRIAPATLALTSDELLTVVTPDARVPIQRLEPLLIEADAIKFGQHPVTSEQARAFATEAREVVSGVEQAEQARLAALRTEKKDAGRNQKELRRQAEDKARQESRRKNSEAA